jgi:thymidylate kinase
MLASLFARLRAAGVEWALLRVPRDLELPPGDVDLLVRPDHLATFDEEARAVGFVPVPGWQSWPVLLYIGFDRPTARFVVLDVTDRVSFGSGGDFTTVAAAGVLARRVHRGDLVTPAPDDAFWLLLLHCLLDKTAVPEHYRERLRAGALDTVPSGGLAALVDRRAGAARELRAEELRERAAAGDWSGLETLAGDLRSRWARGEPWARRALAPAARLVRRGARVALLTRRRGISVALLGTNGAGKSTLSEGLVEAFPLPVSTVYMGLWKDADETASLPRQVAAAAARPFRAWSRYLTALSLQARGHLVVFDRYVYDARIPPTPPLVVLKRAYFWLLSRTCGRPDLTVLLDLPGAVAFGRKGEDGIAETEAQRQEFLAIGRDLGAHVVDATRGVTDVQAAVLALVWDVYRNRWRGRSPASDVDGRGRDAGSAGDGAHRPDPESDSADLAS